MPFSALTWDVLFLLLQSVRHLKTVNIWFAVSFLSIPPLMYAAHTAVLLSLRFITLICTKVGRRGNTAECKCLNSLLADKHAERRREYDEWLNKGGDGGGTGIEKRRKES